MQQPRHGAHGQEERYVIPCAQATMRAAKISKLYINNLDRVSYIINYTLTKEDNALILQRNNNNLSSELNKKHPIDDMRILHSLRRRPMQPIAAKDTEVGIDNEDHVRDDLSSSSNLRPRHLNHTYT